MFTFEQIKELIELVSDHGLQGLEVERSGFRVQVTGRGQQSSTLVAAPEVVEPQPVVMAAVPQALVQGDVATPQAAPVEAEGEVVESPIVGTFYSAPSPDADPFVRVGDRVRKGQVLCIVEAMKLMNEIEADVAGEITQIYPEDAQPVEYGEPLFRIKS